MDPDPMADMDTSITLLRNHDNICTELFRTFTYRDMCMVASSIYHHNGDAEGARWVMEMARAANGWSDTFMQCTARWIVAADTPPMSPLPHAYRSLAACLKPVGNKRFSPVMCQHLGMEPNASNETVLVRMLSLFTDALAEAGATPDSAMDAIHDACVEWKQLANDKVVPPQPRDGRVYECVFRFGHGIAVGVRAVTPRHVPDYRIGHSRNTNTARLWGVRDVFEVAVAPCGVTVGVTWDLLNGCAHQYPPALMAFVWMGILLCPAFVNDASPTRRFVGV